MSNYPRTGASVVVQQQGKILLIKRGKEPYKGCWSLPGGAQENGETLEKTARRELEEETSLKAGTLTFAKVRDRITKDDTGEVVFHYVLATFVVETFSGSPRALDDADDVGWFSLAEVKDLQTTPELPAFLTEILETVIAGK